MDLSDSDWRLLCVLARACYGLTASELAAEMGWHRDTAALHLRHLERAGLVYRESSVWFVEEGISWAALRQRPLRKAHPKSV